MSCWAEDSWFDSWYGHSVCFLPPPPSWTHSSHEIYIPPPQKKRLYRFYDARGLFNVYRGMSPGVRRSGREGDANSPIYGLHGALLSYIAKRDFWCPQATMCSGTQNTHTRTRTSPYLQHKPRPTRTNCTFCASPTADLNSQSRTTHNVCL
jgi:hypothetical protein